VFAAENDRAPDLDAAFIRRIGVEDRIAGWRSLAMGLAAPVGKTSRVTGLVSLAS
jgi:hypothetical protein